MTTPISMAYQITMASVERRFSVGTLFWWNGKAANAQLTPDLWDDRNGADLNPGHGTRNYVGAGRGSPWLIGKRCILVEQFITTYFIEYGLSTDRRLAIMIAWR